jgi:hypothetical protein
MPRKQAHANADAFLAAYRLTGSVTEAAAAAGVDRRLHYRWLKASPVYKQRFDQAKVEAADRLEDIAISRVRDGVLEDVYYQGDVVGERRVYDSGLLQFLLRGLKPERYGRKVELTGPEGGPVQVSIAETIRQRRAERLAKLDPKENHVPDANEG